MGAKTLFATHYHELIELENLLPGVKNYNIAVKKRGDDIIFLRRIVRGGTDDSYGIEVAKLAGVPEWIINRAKDILKDIEAGSIPTHVKIVNEESNMGKNNDNKLDDLRQKIFDRLLNLDLNTTTPIEAMGILFDLKKLVKD